MNTEIKEIIKDVLKIEWSTLVNKHDADYMKLWHKLLEKELESVIESNK